jgi:uncharacterized protein (TIGR02453 family)
VAGKQSIGPFQGWPEASLTWFRELEANNTRDWFQAHRSTYDDAVRGPLEALLAEVDGEFGEGKVFRPNRDTRFSKDKSPYKTTIYAVIPHPAGPGGYYVQLRSEGLFVGGGLYGADTAQLKKVRNAIVDERTGPELAEIVAQLKAARIELMTDGALKTAPRGFPKDHPRIDLLRLPNLAGGTQHPPRAWLHTRKAKDHVVDGWRDLEPLFAWLSANG